MRRQQEYVTLLSGLDTLLLLKILYEGKEPQPLGLHMFELLSILIQRLQTCEAPEGIPHPIQKGCYHWP